MNSRRLHVCFVIPSLAGGGAERAAVEVLNAMDDERWERSMFLFERTGPFLRDVSSGIRIASADTQSPVARWLALRRFIRQSRPDVIVACLSYWTTATAARAAAAGSRVVFAISTPVGAFLDDPDFRWSTPWRRRIFTIAMRAACALADRVIATSKGVADDLVASFGGKSDRIRVVHNPVNVNQVAAAASEPIEGCDLARWTPPVVVAAGRLAEAKNYPLLVDAIGILRERIPATLFILGAGEQESSLRALIATRGLEGSVHLCGFRRNPWSYMARADVFALTSRYEGFGNVLVEAMACGVPVVATASPGTREIITPDANGLLVERHEPHAFADALRRIIEDRTLRDHLAEKARRHAERYRTDAIARDYDRVLTEALA